MKQCPCCGLPTLKVRHEYEICPKCKWEDEPVVEGERSSANGDLTLSQYRTILQITTN
jgi:Zn finger protein HypA/HybF involved in hydrogenase expression